MFHIASLGFSSSLLYLYHYLCLNILLNSYLYLSLSMRWFISLFLSLSLHIYVRLAGETGSYHRGLYYSIQYYGR